MIPEHTTVLVIDDSVHVRFLLRHALQKLGFATILEAANGEEGWQLFLSKSPQLVFLDQIMPHMSGSEVLAKIRAQNSQVRVIMVSSLANAEKIVQVKEMGADHYILKPFTPEKIAQILSKFGWNLESEVLS